MVRIDRDVHHVPGVDVAGDDQVRDESAVLAVGLEGPDADGDRLRQLAGEHERDHGVG